MIGHPVSRRALLAATAAIALGAPGAGAADFVQLPKAMWVWKDRIAEPESLAGFVKAWRVATLLLYTTPDAAAALIANKPQAVETLREFARAGAAWIYLCAGEPDWCRPLRELPEHAALLIAAHRALPQLTAGVHFDVEPNALPEWHDMPERAALAKGMLGFYEFAAQRCAKAEIDAAANPAFALQEAGDGNLLAALARRVGSLSLMAYRDRVASTLQWARPAVSVIRTAGAAWRLGVDVEPEDGEAHITWAGKPPGAFTAAMQSLHDQAQQTGYLGLCFQSYDGLRALLSG
jgi:hypothetical protein